MAGAERQGRWLNQKPKSNVRASALMPAPFQGQGAFVSWLVQQFELSRDGGAHNVRPMEGLRGFAVLLVFFVHYVALVDPWISEQASVVAFAESLQTIGNAGVDLFFVLSGYLIYGSLVTRRRQFFRFISRRAERIYPAFVVVFAIYIFLSFAFPSENKIPSGAAQGTLYLAENFLLLPGLFPVEPMITVAWSLSYEMFYYFAIPLIIAAFGLRDRSAISRTAFFLALAVSFAGYCAIYGGPIRLIMFISGVLLHEIMHSDRVPTPQSYLGMLALILGLLGTLIPFDGYAGAVLKACILSVAFFILCLACFRSPSAWLSRLFSMDPLRWLGNMSYSYYLLHGLTLKASFLVFAKVVSSATFGSWLFWTLLPPMFMLTLIPASILFLLVERPFSLSPHKAKHGTMSGVPLKITPDSAVESDAPQAASRLQ